MSFCYFAKQGGEVDFNKCSKGSVIYLRVAIAMMCSYCSMNFNRLVAKARRIALLKYDLASVFAKKKTFVDRTRTNIQASDHVNTAD